MARQERKPTMGLEPTQGRLDEREGLFNDNPKGLAAAIQIPAARITRLLGIVIDVDPGLLAPDNPLFPPSDDPNRFHQGIRQVLDRHPLARHAEVRSTGRGLHLILRLEPVVELRNAADQTYWANLVGAVQQSLPSDPLAPGITALTRPIGSVNSKNQAVVELIRPGEAISPERVVAFVDEAAGAPFRTVAIPLLGAEQVEPCPICRAAGSRFGVSDRNGRCYGCGRVDLEALLAAVYASGNEKFSSPDQRPEPKRPRRVAR